MLNIGFIGCGGIARLHASRLAQLRNARIVACADASAPAARSFAADYGHAGAEVFTDHRKMLRLDSVGVGVHPDVSARRPGDRYGESGQTRVL